jgi:hypothetical protein
MNRSNLRTIQETSLYRPVKAFLEGLGFVVKGEVGGCDLVALKGGDLPVVVVCELKLTFNLELILQGVDRATTSDEVWLAARLSSRGKGRESDARFRNLCRRLGFGLLGVLPNGEVEVLVSPTAPMPRKNTRRRSRLVPHSRPQPATRKEVGRAQILQIVPRYPLRIARFANKVLSEITYSARVGAEIFPGPHRGGPGLDMLADQ